MIQTDALKTHNLKAENTRLQGELEVRDQLVQQLSQELFRLVKSNAAAPGPEMSEKSKAEVRKRLEEQSRSKKKKGFMTPERKKKLRVIQGPTRLRDVRVLISDFESRSSCFERRRPRS